ncbi:MAG: YHS domain-containing protein [Nitrospirae bacterium]|nr:YHS domain-containing protein [Nitrospirota bacterium]
MAKDPVCGMEVDEEKASKITYKDKMYYFCYASCQWAFEDSLESLRSRSWQKRYGARRCKMSVLTEVMKEESIIHDKDRETPCPDCPVESAFERGNGSDSQDERGIISGFSCFS